MSAGEVRFAPKRNRGLRGIHFRVEMAARFCTAGPCSTAQPSCAGSRGLCPPPPSALNERPTQATARNTVEQAKFADCIRDINVVVLDAGSILCYRLSVRT